VLLFNKPYGNDSGVTQPNGAINSAHNLCSEDILFQDMQLVRLLVSAMAYQPANSVFLSQQTNTSQAY